MLKTYAPDEKELSTTSKRKIIAPKEIFETKYAAIF